MVSGRVLPWLQDVEDQDVWTAWGINYRDVLILDAENRAVDVYNLSNNSLADDENYATLRTKLLDAAAIEGAVQLPAQR